MSSKKFILFLFMYKMYQISAEGYKNARVSFLKVQRTDEIWASMKMLEVVWVLKTYLI